MEAKEITETSHPLFSKRFSRLSSWRRWQERWDAVETVEEAVGLLHVGFDVPVEHWHENEARISLYLKTADGFREPDFFETVDDCTAKCSSFSERPSTMAGEVALKAWRVLCDGVFKNRQEEREEPSWLLLIKEPMIFKEIIWFFSVGSCRNLPWLGSKDYHSEVARQFLKDMIGLVWHDSRFRSWPMLEGARALHNESRPLMAEILCRMSSPDILRRRRLEIDQPTLARLRELALVQRLGSGSYGSLEEAVHDYAPVAELVLVIEADLRAAARQEAIREAEQQRREAEATIASLSS